MTNSNSKTIQSYEDHVQDYIDGTPQEISGQIKIWIDESLSNLNKDAKIIEFGSANGRDANYIKSLGYEIQCTDATQAFVDLLKTKGFNATSLNIITDDLDGPYDLIFAQAVLLHFTREEVKLVLEKVFKSLKPGGRFAFTLKQGEGEEWTNKKLGAPRFFCYWNQEQIEGYLNEVGFENIKITSDVSTKNATWIQIISYKK
ncbi:MAG TPA: methyltransferase domain-containing protein [Candidatus Saccharimonadales bacterium]|nr:methyltransferase domain-containing protein [Candidatus Saccharimonadales bacterium]